MGRDPSKSPVVVTAAVVRSPLSDTSLSGFCDRLADLTERLDQQRCRVVMILNRLGGPVPEPTRSPRAPGKPESLLGRMEAFIDGMAGDLDELESATARLDNLL